MVVRVFVAGGSGALGRRLVPQLSVGQAVAAARPDAIVHQMTALSAAHAGKPDLKHPDRGFGNAKAKRELGWQLRYPSWRQGFKEGLA